MSHLNITEAVPLGYALVARVAHDAGVRALCIKGPLTSELGLRPSHHVSQDVDVLVAPDQLGDLVDALCRVGWERVPVWVEDGTEASHSLQLRRPDLGVEVDLHHRYPGFARSPEDVFEALWRRRRTVLLADSPCQAVDETASYLIELLHLARDPKYRAPRLRRVLADHRLVLTDLTLLVKQTGAEHATAPYLGEIRDLESPQDAAWDRRVLLGREPWIPIFLMFRRTPFARWPYLTLRLAWLPSGQAFAQRPDLRTARLGLLRAQASRWWRGAMHFPRAVRSWRQIRGSKLIVDD